MYGDVPNVAFFSFALILLSFTTWSTILSSKSSGKDLSFRSNFFIFVVINRVKIWNGFIWSILSMSTLAFPSLWNVMLNELMCTQLLMLRAESFFCFCFFCGCCYVSVVADLLFFLQVLKWFFKPPILLHSCPQWVHEWVVAACTTLLLVFFNCFISGFFCDFFFCAIVDGGCTFDFFLMFDVFKVYVEASWETVHTGRTTESERDIHSCWVQQ